MKILAPYFEQIEAGIKELNIPSKPVNLYEPFRYVLTIGGKRIRPALTLMAAQACGGNSKNALHAALAVELFHNFTLVHDDIMDNAPIRRGRPTVHEQWSKNIAVLTGDVMLVKAYDQLAKLPAEILPAAFQLFNKTAAEICEGQQFDIDFEDRTDVHMNDYVEMIRLKTAVLLGCAMQLGAQCSATSTKNANHLYNFGVSLGLAFQVKDDYLDAYGKTTEVGKQNGGDIIANKKTFLYLKFIEKASAVHKKEMLTLYSPSRLDDTLKIKRVLELFSIYSIDKEMQQLAETFYNQAIQSLNSCDLPEGNKAPLLEFANQLMNRNH